MNYDLAVIGSPGTTAIYRMLGVHVYPAATADESKALMETLMKETQADGVTPRFAVVFLEENLHATLPQDLIEKLTKRALPAVIPVPTPSSKGGKKSYGVKRLYSLVERAVGSNILG